MSDFLNTIGTLHTLEKMGEQGRTIDVKAVLLITWGTHCAAPKKMRGWLRLVQHSNAIVLTNWKHFCPSPWLRLLQRMVVSAKPTISSKRCWLHGSSLSVPSKNLP